MGKRPIAPPIAAQNSFPKHAYAHAAVSTSSSTSLPPRRLSLRLQRRSAAESAPAPTLPTGYPPPPRQRRPCFASPPRAHHYRRGRPSTPELPLDPTGAESPDKPPNPKNGFLVRRRGELW
ncbi:hypothetical protein GQ55_5G448500 [Panicum hallii var. hallii]|uniref:Uncharacterized protein n=1 Tax=Panicum hallii var. hallii TaxID=1504633 RepID=A0A2T7DQ44_9POAL|nr:hypothetical protein GQ55_5G448500 [Panicum hallii var. hallii]